jgi:hypothetical protein
MAIKRIGRMATYPARSDYLSRAVTSLSGQLDKLYVIANEYSRKAIKKLPAIENVEYIIPECDLKDTGKFVGDRDPRQLVFLLDDDLLYPDNYVSTLAAAYGDLGIERAVVGLHGVVYSDLFDGAANSRFVAKFDKALERRMVVNQLGTGCIMTRGDLLPSFDYMASSQRFVDVRFARYCYEQKIAMVCLARAAGWIRDLEPQDSIFESYTRANHGRQLAEILTFGGFGKLDPRVSLKLEF